MNKKKQKPAAKLGFLSRSKKLRDQVKKTWAPPLYGATLGSASQTSVMISLAWCFGVEFLGDDLTVPQRIAVERGMTVMMESFDSENLSLPHRKYIEALTRTQLSATAQAMLASGHEVGTSGAYQGAVVKLFLIDLVERHGPQWMEEANRFVADASRREVAP